MTFKSQLKEDALSCFLNTNEFAENITYIIAGGSIRIIKALVNRGQIKPSREDSLRTLQNQAELFVLNDEASGTSLINKKDDKIILTDLEGDTKECRIVEVLNKDDALWHLLVEW